MAARMSSRQFRESLAALDLRVEDWARLTGVRRQRVLRWCHDEERIPAWVPVFNATLAIREAKDVVLARLSAGSPAPQARRAGKVEKENADGGEDQARP